MEFVTLNNGVKMPILGYGTFQTPPKATAENVEMALNAGYRSIDTAQVYGNEAGVGQALKQSRLARDQVFITSKTSTDGYAKTKQGIDMSLKRLGSDHFDLLIIHWPTPNSLDSYHALEDALAAGKTRAIGVSNFNAKELELLINNSHIVPAVDQIETHLYWQQTKMRAYLQQHNIVHEAWAPLAESLGAEMMQLPEVEALSSKYGVSPAQILLRFLTQQQIVAIPKSLNPEHMASNFDIFGFNLTSEEVDSLTKFDRHRSIKDWPINMRENAY